MQLLLVFDEILHGLRLVLVLRTRLAHGKECLAELAADKNKAAENLSPENSSYKESAVMYTARNIAEKVAAKKAAEEALAAAKLAEEEAARKAK